MVKAARTQFVDSMVEVYEAMLSALEATEARGHKVSRALLTEARRGEKEVETLARKWAEHPAMIADNISAAIDAQANAERRALELARESLGAAQEYREEVQKSLAKVIAANQEAASALRRAAREGYPRVRSAAAKLRKTAASRLRRRAPARAPAPARTPARKAAKRTTRARKAAARQ